MHYFSSHFKRARGSLERVLYTKRPEAAMIYRAITYLIIVYYELGEVNLGIKYISVYLDDITVY
jgi:hypothetical protein